MQKNVNLQDLFLNSARRDRTPATIFLVNGFQIKGIVRGFDNFTVVVDSDGKQQLIYKSAISTICPMRPIKLTEEAEAAAAEAKTE